MESVNYDLSQVRSIIGGFHFKKDRYHDLVFYNSNENLSKLFSGIDLKDKEILSVLASSDQLFYFYDNGAKLVDTFDKNKLTFYYFYLRKWFIQYKNKYYITNVNRRSLLKLLSSIKASTEDEEKALYFWKSMIDTYDIKSIFDLFIFDENIKKNTIRNCKRIKEKLEENKLTFYNVDISKRFRLNKKYDVIYKSNISDYVCNSREVLETYRDNFDSLLKDDGIIISSNLTHDYDYSNEFGVFSEKFNYRLLNNSIGYVYTRR